MRRLMSINSALQYIVIVLACLVAFARNVHGAGTSQPSVAQTVSVDVNSVGNASVVLSFQTDQKSVDFWQEKHASAGAFVRWTHLDNSWSPRQNEALTFGAAKDGTIPVTVE
jgi:hypothetical protein